MKENKKHQRRVRNLILALVFTAILLSVSTYAWFIGMRTVNVDSFDVEIAAAEELELSLNGKNWSETVSISADTFDDPLVVYDTHTNWWAGKGLIPMSSVGVIDTTASRLELYEKASLTPTKGGYRLNASQVPNTGANEVEGYVAFDLFIRNNTGAQYISALDIDDEEAIYLDTASAVGIGSANGVEKTGIENSVRVAFAQIGRVKGTIADGPGGVTEPANQDIITGITCNNGIGVVTGDVTSICRVAQIWEPNDAKHVDNAINWYETSCKTRTGALITDYDNDESCNALGANPLDKETAYPTYAIKEEIISADVVDVYDGVAYNGWDGNTYDETTNPTGKLYEFPYFTDTMKNLPGVQRPQFMTLAPNSVTKVRVYIWIEGQDIDNYDFAALGRSISVKFGFTKQRINPDDFGYEDPTSTTTP